MSQKKKASSDKTDNSELPKSKIPPATFEEAAVEVKVSKSDNKELEALMVELETAKEKASANWDMLVRKEAELQNFRKQSQRDMERATRFGLERTVSDFLSVLDSFEQGLNLEIEDPKAAYDSLKEGMEMTFTIFKEVLKKANVEEINPENTVFDPKFHEALSMQETSDCPPNHVFAVIQKGYQLHDRIIRPARVIVAKAPQVSESKENS